LANPNPLTAIEIVENPAFASVAIYKLAESLNLGGFV
jgi:hypothetical protein